MVHIHRHLGKGVGQLAAHILRKLDGGHGKALVGALGLHLEAFCGGKGLGQIAFGAGHDGVLVLFAGAGTADLCHAKDLGHGLKSAVNIAGFVFRLHIYSGLHTADVKIAEGAQPPLDIAHELLLEIAPVLALQDDLALLE